MVTKLNGEGPEAPTEGLGCLFTERGWGTAGHRAGGPASGHTPRTPHLSRRLRPGPQPSAHLSRARLPGSPTLGLLAQGRLVTPARSP